jgi:hypothetical protein
MRLTLTPLAVCFNPTYHQDLPPPSSILVIHSQRLATLTISDSLDRVNIGNARLYGMEEDLNLGPNQYQIAVSLLFVTYIASELPSNLVIKKFTPSRWLSFITTALEGGLFPGLGKMP